MKCYQCPALRICGYEYPDESCALGVADEDTIEFKDGSYGCNRRSVAKLKRELAVADNQEAEAFAEMAESFVKFLEEQEREKQIKEDKHYAGV